MKNLIPLCGLLTVVSSVIAVPQCLASSDIVYSARYYYPPTVHATSHYHIYQIDPDGRHKIQLTFGKSDDYDPKWSPDRKWIAYTRENSNPGGVFLFAMHPDGTGNKRVVETGFGNWSWNADSKTLGIGGADYTNDSHTHEFDYSLNGKLVKTRTVPNIDQRISPDGLYKYANVYPANNGILKNAWTGKIIVTTPTYITGAAWLSNTELAGIGITTTNPGNYINKPGYYSFMRLGIDGVTKESTPLTPSDKNTAKYNNGINFSQIKPIPSRPGAYLAWQDWLMHENEGLFYVLPSHGTLRYLANSIHSTCGFHGHYVSSTPYRNTSDYDAYRVVWTNPLQITDIDTGKTKQIVTGLVDVQATDWR